MLDLAYMCYKSASQCVDEESEEWLTDYMMGKCLEKMHKAPKEYLNYYKQVYCQIIPMIFIWRILFACKIKRVSVPWYIRLVWFEKQISKYRKRIVFTV